MSVDSWRFDEIRKRCFNRLLKLHYDTQSCHLGGNLSCLDILVYLFHFHMQPEDVFILSKGHAAGALYIVLWSLGKLADDELDTFHKDGTMLCGHASPPYAHFATGSLGHGLSLANGIGIARRVRNEKGHVYCLLGDGEAQEGMVQEALTWELPNVTAIVDGNRYQGFSNTGNLYDGLMINGHSFSSLKRFFNDNQHRPFLWCLTVKGNGAPLAGTLESHYLPLTKEAYEKSLR